MVYLSCYLVGWCVEIVGGRVLKFLSLRDLKAYCSVEFMRSVLSIREELQVLKFLLCEYGRKANSGISFVLIDTKVAVGWSLLDEMARSRFS